MSVTPATEPPRYAMEAISQDALFFLTLIKTALSHPRASLIILGAIPITSLFVVESYDYLSRFPDRRPQLDARRELLIRTSRHRVKLLVSKISSIDEITGEIGTIVDQHKKRFVDSHTGLLAPLKRLIQPDLGLFTYDGHLFSTTHAAEFSFGSGNDPRAGAREFSEDIAGYVADIVNKLGLSDTDFDCPAATSDAPIPAKFIMKDVKNAGFYSRGSLGTLGTNFAAGISYVLASLSYAHFILRELPCARSETFFKIKFLCAYYANDSLNTLQSVLHGRRALPPKAAAVLSVVLSNPQSKWLRKRDNLREFLVHYQPQKLTNDMAGLSYRELVSRFLGTKSFGHVDLLLDDYISNTIKALEAGFALSPNTFWYGQVE